MCVYAVILYMHVVDTKPCTYIAIAIRFIMKVLKNPNAYLKYSLHMCRNTPNSICDLKLFFNIWSRMVLQNKLCAMKLCILCNGHYWSLCTRLVNNGLVYHYVK